jgi:hypothetical protein
MKKLICIVVFTIVVCASISSCTEEVVKPQDGVTSAGTGIKD